MDRERLDRWCERGILSLTLAILAFGPLATGAVRPKDFALIQWLVTALLIGWGIRLWTQPTPKLLLPPITWTALAFVAYAVVRYLCADIEYLARQEMIKVITYGSLFIVLLTTVHRVELTHTIALCLLCLASGVAAYGIFQYLTGSNHVWHFLRPEVYQNRGSGTYICPNHFAGFLEMLMPLSLTYTLCSNFSTRLRITLGLIFATIFLGIVVSLSRGGWIASASSLVVFLVWMVRNPRYRVRALLVCALLAVASFAFLAKAKVSAERKHAFSLVDRTGDLRLRIWNPAVDMWLDHKWLGVGPNHFNTRYRQYRSSHDQSQRTPNRVHNDYLNTLSDWGIIGTLLVSSSWILFFWGVVRTFARFQGSTKDEVAPRTNEAAFVLGAGLGLVAILVHSFVDFNMHIPANAILAVTLLALVTNQLRLTSDRYQIQPKRALKVLISILVVSGAGYLGGQAWKLSAENYWLSKAAGLTGTTAGLEALQRAFHHNQNPETAHTLGETYRAMSWQGLEDYRETATNAMRWLKHSMDLNPWNPYSFVSYGMCLDWLGRHDEATPYFEKATFELDPNGYYTVAHMGWHYIQLDDYATAREWFLKSMSIYWIDNPISQSYLQLIDQHLNETKEQP